MSTNRAEKGASTIAWGWYERPTRLGERHSARGPLGLEHGHAYTRREGDGSRSLPCSRMALMKNSQSATRYRTPNDVEPYTVPRASIRTQDEESNDESESCISRHVPARVGMRKTARIRQSSMGQQRRKENLNLAFKTKFLTDPVWASRKLHIGGGTSE